MIYCNWCVIKLLLVVDPDKNDAAPITADCFNNHKKYNIPNNLFLFMSCR